MSDINHILIDGCSLCAIFSNLGEKFVFIDKNDINLCDFVIFSTQNGNLVVVRDHIGTISNSLWGRIIYECRKLYGNSIRLQCNPLSVDNHWHAYVVN